VDENEVIGYEVFPDVYYEIWDMKKNVFENGELFYIIESESEPEGYPFWVWN